MSSLSPGCSPTKTTFAVRRPSPNTVCVAFFQRSQASQCAAASRPGGAALTVIGIALSVAVYAALGLFLARHGAREGAVLGIGMSVGAGAGVIGGSIRAYLVRDYLGGVLGDYGLGGLLTVTL